MKTLIALIALATAAVAAPAGAAVTYMTGAYGPWGTTSNDAAMDVAFGSGNWNKVETFTTAPLADSSFLFIDGSDGNADAFGDFLSAHGSDLSAYVARGGRLLVQEAPNQNAYDSYALPGGLTVDGIHGYSYPTASGDAALTAHGLTAGLDAAGAGTSWTGYYFAHAGVSGGTCLISGSAGCILAQSGTVVAGGETAADFHSEGGFQLRVNEIKYAAGDGASTGAVPEASTWTMMIAGFGLVGATARRRRSLALA